MNILLSLFDFVAVICFLLGAIILQRDLYNKMSKGAFAVFSTGSIIVFIAGLFKAVHKFAYYAFNRDVFKLQESFFPMMAAGFLLTGVGLLAMIVHPQKEKSTTKLTSITLPILMVFGLVTLEEVVKESGTMFFVVFMVLGVALMDVCLGLISVNIKKPWLIVVVVINFVFILGMGYLSSKEGMNDWIKEFVNAIAQGSFLLIAILLRKFGLGKEDSLDTLLKTHK